MISLTSRFLSTATPHLESSSQCRLAPFLAHSRWTVIETTLAEAAIEEPALSAMVALVEALNSHRNFKGSLQSTPSPSRQSKELRPGAEQVHPNPLEHSAHPAGRFLLDNRRNSHLQWAQHPLRVLGLVMVPTPSAAS